MDLSLLLSVGALAVSILALGLANYALFIACRYERLLREQEKLLAKEKTSVHKTKPSHEYLNKTCAEAVSVLNEVNNIINDIDKRYKERENQTFTVKCVNCRAEKHVKIADIESGFVQCKCGGIMAIAAE